MLVWVMLPLLGHGPLRPHVVLVPHATTCGCSGARLGNSPSFGVMVFSDPHVVFVTLVSIMWLTLLPLLLLVVLPGLLHVPIFFLTGPPCTFWILLIL